MLFNSVPMVPIFPLYAL